MKQDDLSVVLRVMIREVGERGRVNLLKTEAITRDCGGKEVLIYITSKAGRIRNCLRNRHDARRMTSCKAILLLSGIDRKNVNPGYRDNNPSPHKAGNKRVSDIEQFSRREMHILQCSL